MLCNFLILNVISNFVEILFNEKIRADNNAAC